MTQTYTWWQRGIIYQIYPRSFMDSNGDGVGDLAGIIAKLDYLAWLGVDAIWISPIYPSPMADFGYDIADYTNIDPIFGRLDNFDTLVAAAHQRGLKVILDYVPNHCSAAHPWFQESRRSRTNPQRAWFIWRDPAPDGGPPTNWLSEFSGPAWTYDPTTAQYYYHAYLPQQPDLNWRNPEVQAAMLAVLRFWLERGVDGFRIDALRQLIKDDQWRDNPPNPAYQSDQNPARTVLATYTADRPEVLAMLALMRQTTDAYPERVLIGELYLPIERLVMYYGERGRGVHLPFNFHLLFTPWQAREIAALIATYEAALPPGGWPNWVLGNHDRTRIASRVGPAQARVAAMLLLTLRGTPTLYYGDELGMANVAIPPDQVQDPVEHRTPGRGRDPVRTPMQWDSTPYAGFSPHQPWLPVADNYAQCNVAVAQDDPTSILHLYRHLITLRRNEPALAVGNYLSVPTTGNVLAYLRSAGTSQFLIALNLGEQPQQVDVGYLGSGRLILSTHLDRTDELVADGLKLRANEGIIVQLK